MGRFESGRLGFPSQPQSFLLRKALAFNDFGFGRRLKWFHGLSVANWFCSIFSYAMKAHVEIKIRLAQVPKEGLHKILRDFADQTEGWRFKKEQSEDYKLHHGSDAGFVMCVDKKGLEAASVALANIERKHPSTFYLTNIIPQERSHLSVDQYNAVGLAFVDEFRRWLRIGTFQGTVDIIGPNRTLKEIIPGNKSRAFFEAWLHSPTPTSHPSDIRMLDRFICHLFRHRGKTRTWEIEPYLVHDLGWSPNTARWVVLKIETGLELLRVDRKF